MEKFCIMSLLVIFFIGCSKNPTKELIEEITNSDDYVIKALHYHGNIVGKSRRTDRTDVFQINNNKVKFLYNGHPFDSTIEYVLPNTIIEELHDIIFSAFISHDDNKEYAGCCMSHEIDLKLIGNSQKTIIKPTGTDWYDKYNELVKRILTKDLQKYYEIDSIMQKHQEQIIQEQHLLDSIQKKHLTDSLFSFDE